MKNYSADMILVVNWQRICLALNYHVNGAFSRVGSEMGKRNIQDWGLTWRSSIRF